MFHRFFWLGLLTAPIATLHAAPASQWDCQRDANGAWQCLGNTPATSAATVTTPALNHSTTSNVTALPTPSAGEENTAPTATDALQITTAPTHRPSRTTGWNCDAAEDEARWNCQLIGPDPKGKPRLVAEEATDWSLFTPAFSWQDEQVFHMLNDEFGYDPWQNCAAPHARPAAAQRMPAPARDDLPVNVIADYSEVFDEEISNFWGNVDVRRGDQHVKAERAHYDSVSKTLDAQGNVFYSESQLALFSRSAQLQLGNDKARLRDALFISPTLPIRGRAKAAFRESKSFSYYEDAAYTSCRPGNQDWVIHASDLKMNKASGMGAAKNVWLEFKGLPVLYSPYLSFPIDDRRMTGFLAPSFGRTNSVGFDATIPYYWNIAPNYDARFWGRYLEKRGPLFGGHFRYLTEMTRGDLMLEVLPQDTLRDSTRWQGVLRNQTQFVPGLSSNASLNYVSDRYYFDELRSALAVIDNRFTHSFADMNFNHRWINAMARVEYYQTIDTTVPQDATPYRRLPQTQINLAESFEPWGQHFPIKVGLDNEFVYFQHDYRSDEGFRANFKPYVSLPIQTASAFFVPRASMYYTQYWLDPRQTGLPTQIDRALPVFSADGGLFFEREFGSGDNAFIHTLEPRLFYLYIPHQNQDEIPVFDSALFDFDFYQLFRENRFSGTDRIQDANQVTTALTSRLLDSQTGLERLALSVGQIFYFRDRTVGLLPNTLETDTYSNLVTQVNSQLTEHLSLVGGLQWNYENNRFDRSEGALRYRDRSAGNKLFNLGYRFRRGLIDQTDVSFVWPLYDDWSMIGRWQYSILENLSLETFVGFEKESCCWRFRIIGRRYVTSINDDAQNGLFVQLELKGLTSFGERVERFLEQRVEGYRRPL